MRTKQGVVPHGQTRVSRLGSRVGHFEFRESRQPPLKSWRGAMWKQVSERLEVLSFQDINARCFTLNVRLSSRFHFWRFWEGSRKLFWQLDMLWIQDTLAIQRCLRKTPSRFAYDADAVLPDWFFFLTSAKLSCFKGPENRSTDVTKPEKRKISLKLLHLNCETQPCALHLLCFKVQKTSFFQRFGKKQAWYSFSALFLQVLRLPVADANAAILLLCNRRWAQ